jgi:hypothetical protein
MVERTQTAIAAVARQSFDHIGSIGGQPMDFDRPPISTQIDKARAELLVAGFLFETVKGRSPNPMSKPDAAYRSLMKAMAFFSYDVADRPHIGVWRVLWRVTIR